MASPEWIEIFEGWDTEKIRAHMTRLEGDISVYVSQGIGSKNYTKDLGELRGQLAAATRVLKARASKGNSGFGVSDFSTV
jgi:hypothetical protein